MEYKTEEIKALAKKYQSEDRKGKKDSLIKSFCGELKRIGGYEKLFGEYITYAINFRHYYLVFGNTNSGRYLYFHTSDIMHGDFRWNTGSALIFYKEFNQEDKSEYKKATDTLIALRRKYRFG